MISRAYSIDLAGTPRSWAAVFVAVLLAAACVAADPIRTWIAALLKIAFLYVTWTGG